MKRGRSNETLKRQCVANIRYEMISALREYKWANGHEQALNEALRSIKTIQLDRSDRPLVIFDLNHVLVYRVFDPKKTIPVDHDNDATRFGNTVIYTRPGIQKMLAELHKTCDLAVWSSMRDWRVKQVVDHVFGDPLNIPLVCAFDQSHCMSVVMIDETDPKGTTEKYLFYKNLSTVWDLFPQYDASNTILVDNDAYKSSNNPKRCLHLVDKWSTETSLRTNRHMLKDLCKQLDDKINQMVD